jgi:amidase
VLRERGAVLVEVPALPETDELPVLIHEFTRDLDAYLADLPEGAPVRSMRELLEWNAAHADRALKFGQVLLEQALAVDHDAEHAAYVVRRRATSPSPASTASTRRWPSRTPRPSSSLGRTAAGSQRGRGTPAWSYRRATAARGAGRSA